MSTKVEKTLPSSLQWRNNLTVTPTYPSSHKMSMHQQTLASRNASAPNTNTTRMSLLSCKSPERKHCMSALVSQARVVIYRAHRPRYWQKSQNTHPCLLELALLRKLRLHNSATLQQMPFSSSMERGLKQTSMSSSHSDTLQLLMQNIFHHWWCPPAITTFSSAEINAVAGLALCSAALRPPSDAAGLCGVHPAFHSIDHRILLHYSPAWDPGGKQCTALTPASAESAAVWEWTDGRCYHLHAAAGKCLQKPPGSSLSFHSAWPY